MKESFIYNYGCTVIAWLDGDTAYVDIDLGFGLHLAQHVRVYGINAPEVHSTNKEEKDKGLAAKAKAELLCPPASVVLIHTAKGAEPMEKFGRWLASITLADGRDFATAMIDAGCAQPYFGGPR